MTCHKIREQNVRPRAPHIVGGPPVRLSQGIPLGAVWGRRGDIDIDAP